MGKPKTNYDPNSYDRSSLASIMRYITADLMIGQDVEGAEAFRKFQPQVVALRRAIDAAYRQQFIDRTVNPVPVMQVAEGVLLWLREGATVEEVVDAPTKELLKRGRGVGRK